MIALKWLPLLFFLMKYDRHLSSGNFAALYDKRYC